MPRTTSEGRGGCLLRRNLDLAEKPLRPNLVPWMGFEPIADKPNNAVNLTKYSHSD